MARGYGSFSIWFSQKYYTAKKARRELRAMEIMNKCFSDNTSNDSNQNKEDKNNK